MRVQHFSPFPFLKRIFFVFCFLFFLFALLPTPRVSADIDGLVAKINQYRASNGLGKLSEDQNLTNAACWLAADNASINKSGHIDSLGRDMAPRLAVFGIGTGYRAENVAAWTYSKGASYAFDLWRNSSGHNANMLGPNYTRIGIGNAFSNGWQYVAADFASGSATSLSKGCGTNSNPTPLPSNQNPPKNSVNPTALPKPPTKPVPAPPSSPVLGTTSQSTTPDTTPKNTEGSKVPAEKQINYSPDIYLGKNKTNSFDRGGLLGSSIFTIILLVLIWNFHRKDLKRRASLEIGG